MYIVQFPWVYMSPTYIPNGYNYAWYHTHVFTALPLRLFSTVLNKSYMKLNLTNNLN